MNSFGTQTTLESAGNIYYYHSLRELSKQTGVDLEKIPFSLRIVLENLLRNEDGVSVQKKDIERLANWHPKHTPGNEIQFKPARVLLQDFTGVPAIADLAAMRSAMRRLGASPSRINPLVRADLVIDHSVQVDEYGTQASFGENSKIEFYRNSERYRFLRWGSNAFRSLRIVPPDTGIVHQVNLELLSKVAYTSEEKGKSWIYPDTLIGTDSHTTMINGLGILAWGVGGIEAEAAMLGESYSFLIPQVVGFKLTGTLPDDVVATDLVLTITHILRKKGVVGKFVEFFGSGASTLTVADRATLSNMAPEYGATVGFFPIDEETTKYLSLTGRPDAAHLVESYFRIQDLWYSPDRPQPEYSDVVELDLATIKPSLAGPARPQDQVTLKSAGSSFRRSLVALLDDNLKELDKATYTRWIGEGGSPTSIAPELAHEHHYEYDKHSMGILTRSVAVHDPLGISYDLTHGSIVIAAITSCTNTSNPAAMLAAGLIAKKAIERGLQIKPWVKPSLAPGSKAVTGYLTDSGLMPYLEALKFHLVGYGCTTCIGNSGPLPEHINDAIISGDLVAAAVLSGNRNFEGRIHPLVRANYLCSPPLVVAYALAGTIDIDLHHTSLGIDPNGNKVFLEDLWPSKKEITELMKTYLTAEQFHSSYKDVFAGDKNWKSLKIKKDELFTWETDSTYVKEPPFLKHVSIDVEKCTDIKDARVLALLDDSITTDHISPAGTIDPVSPAGQYLLASGVQIVDFNSYGSRRGNHEVMMRGTFANRRLKNHLTPGVEGGVTKYIPNDELMPIFYAAMKYRDENIPLIVIAGKEYGTGSSRDWAAKGPKLLGVRAVIAESYERIHRSNLIGMGVLPLQFLTGESARSLSLTGHETFSIGGLSKIGINQQLEVRAKLRSGQIRIFSVTTRIDAETELRYFEHGGILPFVLRKFLAEEIGKTRAA